MPKFATLAGVGESSMRNYLSGKSTPVQEKQDAILSRLTLPTSSENPLEEVPLKDSASNEAPAYLTAGEDAPSEDRSAVDAAQAVANASVTFTPAASLPDCDPAPIHLTHKGLIFLSHDNPDHHRFSA